MLERDKQADFNAAYIGVIKQGRPCLDAERLSDGCIVGALNDPEDPHCHCAIGHMANPGTTEDSRFYLDILHAHDESAADAAGYIAARIAIPETRVKFIELFKKSMFDIANRYGLTVPEVV